jgi:hypothetical protein
MNGIFSATPSPAVVRPLVGSMLLFLVEAAFVLGSPDTPGGLRAIVILIVGVGIIALAVAIAGAPEAPANRKTQRHGA